MANPLSSRPKSYPVFKANQVLTEKQLNKAVDFFNAEAAAARTSLIGVGVIDGLELRSDLTSVVCIGRGLGITTQGHTVALDREVSFAWAREVAPPPELAKKLGNPATVLELLEEGEASDAKSKPLAQRQDVLRGKTVLAFVEKRTAEIRPCVEDSCDGGGAEARIAQRFFLLPSDVASALALDEEELFSRGVLSAGQRPASLAELSLERGQLSNTYLDCLELLKKTAEETRRVVGGWLDACVNEYCDIASIGVGAPTQGVERCLKIAFDEALNKAPAVFSGLQCYLDWLRDLQRGLREFYQAAAQASCMPCPDLSDDGLFPLHLLLGRLQDNDDAWPLLQPPGADPYHKHRTHFLASVALGGEQRDLAACLLQRLVLLIEMFTLEKVGTTIRVTPDAGPGAPLSERSIPAYYGVTKGSDSRDATLRALWCFDRARAGWQADSLSAADTPPEADRPPLACFIDEYPFFRISGLAGNPIAVVWNRLKGLRASAGLPFSMVAVAFEPDANNPSLASVIGDFKKAELDREYAQCRQTWISQVGHELAFFKGFKASPPKGNLKGVLTIPDLTTREKTKGRFLRVLETGELFTVAEDGAYTVELPEGQYTLQAIVRDDTGAEIGTSDRVVIDAEGGETVQQDLTVKPKAASASTQPAKKTIRSSAIKAAPSKSATTEEFLRRVAGELYSSKASELLDSLELTKGMKAMGEETKALEVALPAEIVLGLEALDDLPEKLADVTTTLVAKLKANSAKLSGRADELVKSLSNESSLSPRWISLLQHAEAVSSLCRDCVTTADEVGRLAKEQSDWRADQVKQLMMSEFKTRHPSLEHVGGVWRGGTLVVAYSNGVVVGDFALPYTCQEPLSPLMLVPSESVFPPADIEAKLLFSEQAAIIDVPAAHTGQWSLRSIVTDPGALATITVDRELGRITVKPNTALLELRNYQFEYLLQSPVTGRTTIGKVSLEVMGDVAPEAPADITASTTATSAVIVRPILPAYTRIVSAGLEPGAAADMGIVEIIETDKAVRYQPAAGFTAKGEARMTYVIEHSLTKRTAQGRITVKLAKTTTPAREYTELVEVAESKEIIPLWLQDARYQIRSVEEVVAGDEGELGRVTLTDEKGSITFTPKADEALAGKSGYINVTVLDTQSNQEISSRIQVKFADELKKTPEPPATPKLSQGPLTRSADKNKKRR